MSEAQQAHFRVILEQWRDSLLNQMDATVSHLKDDSQQFADLNDRATQEEEFSLELRTRDREANLSSKISSALKRLMKEIMVTVMNVVLKLVFVV